MAYFTVYMSVIVSYVLTEGRWSVN